MKKNAFTLIELLVVISIIAMLLGILVTALQRVRQTAQTAICSFNIKQVVLAFKLYEEKNYTLPMGYCFRLSAPPGGWPGNMSYDMFGWWWFNFISDYLKEENGNYPNLLCPSRQLNYSNKFPRILCANYGVNTSLFKMYYGTYENTEFFGTPLNSGRIKNPDQTMMLADCGYSIINWNYATDSPPPMSQPEETIANAAYIPGLDINIYKKLRPGMEEDAIDGRHLNKTVNAAFADGHISRMKASDFLVIKNGDTYENTVPLWTPK